MEVLRKKSNIQDESLKRKCDEILKKPFKAQLLMHCQHAYPSYYHYDEMLEFEDKYVFTRKSVTLKFSHKNGFYTSTTVLKGASFKKKGASTRRLTLWKGTLPHDLFNISHELKEFMGITDSKLSIKSKMLPTLSVLTKGSLSAFIAGTYNEIDIVKHHIKYSIPELKIDPKNYKEYCKFIKDIGDVPQAKNFLRTTVYPNEFLKKYKTGDIKSFRKRNTHINIIIGTGIKVNWYNTDSDSAIVRSTQKINAIENMTKMFQHNSIDFNKTKKRDLGYSLPTVANLPF